MRRLPSTSTAGMTLGLITALLIIYAVAWLVYACYHPDTRSGLWLREVSVRSCVSTRRQGRIRSAEHGSTFENPVLPVGPPV